MQIFKLKYIYLYLTIWHVFRILVLMALMSILIDKEKLNIYIFLLTGIFLFLRQFYYQQTGFHFHLNKTIYNIELNENIITINYIYYYIFKGKNTLKLDNSYLIRSNKIGTTMLYNSYILIENEQIKGTIPDGVLAFIFFKNNQYLKYIDLKPELPISFYKKL
jgi:hypothetical protein